MRRDAESENRAGSTTRIFWSAGYLVACPVISLLVLYEIDRGSPLGLFVSAILTVIVFSYCTVSLIVHLVTARFERALAIGAGIALGILIVWNGPTIIGWEGGVQFSRQRAEFDEMVRRERARTSDSEPIRMVVSVEDRSSIATSNSFFFIVYDETDNVIDASNAGGNWRYPKYEAGIIRVGDTSAVKHLAGHYYSFWTSD